MTYVRHVDIVDKQSWHWKILVVCQGLCRMMILHMLRRERFAKQYGISITGPLLRNMDAEMNPSVAKLQIFFLVSKTTTYLYILGTNISPPCLALLSRFFVRLSNGQWWDMELRSMKVVLKLKFLGLPEPSHFAGLWWASELVGRAGTAIISKAGGAFQTSNLSIVPHTEILFYLAISNFLDATSTICIPDSCSGYRRCNCRGCMILSPVLSEDGVFMMIFSKAATIGAYRKSGGENDGIWDTKDNGTSMGPQFVMLR